MLPLKQHNGQKDDAKTGEPRQYFLLHKRISAVGASAVVLKRLDIFAWNLTRLYRTPVSMCTPNFVAIPSAVSRWWTTLQVKPHNGKAVFFALDLYKNLEFWACFGAKV
jgi:hypothetical protein